MYTYMAPSHGATLALVVSIRWISYISKYRRSFCLVQGVRPTVILLPYNLVG